MKTSSLLTSFLLAAFFTLPLAAQDTLPTPATLLGRWTGENLPASAAYGNTYNEIWGLARDGREYAVIGSTLGTHLIDVTRPQDAEQVAFVAGAASSAAVVHRDYHHFGCYLYAVSDEGSGSLQIIDLSGLPDSVEVVYDSPAFFGRCHNIYIDTARAVLYACYARGGESPTVALKLLDISNPTQPREIATYNNFGSGVVSHVHDCFVENGIAFLNLGFDGMAIVDFTNPLEPVYLSTLTDYVYAGYNHSGWPTTDLGYYYLGDESHGFALKILDISDLSEVEVAGTFDADSPNELSIPHNQVVACDYLYVSYYYDGLQIYDIHNPSRPQRISYFSTSSRDHRKSYEGAWGVYPFLPSGNVLVSDMQEGLFILSGPDGNCSGNELMELQCDGLISPTTDPPAQGQDWGLKIYPQPARDHLEVAFRHQKSQEKVNVQLVDIQGRLHQRWEKDVLLGKMALPLAPDIPAGIYLLRIRTDEGYFTKKIIIGQ